jgi:hypothetical protein
VLLGPRGFVLDWLAFADAWRGEYQGAMEEVRSDASRFAVSMCFIVKTSTAYCHGSGSTRLTAMIAAISISLGIGLMPGPT